MGSQIVDAIHVHPKVLAFFVDPPTVYNGINTQVTIYTSGLLAQAQTVILTGPNGTELVYSSNETTFVQPNLFNRIQLVVPEGITAGKHFFFVQ